MEINIHFTLYLYLIIHSQVMFSVSLFSLSCMRLRSADCHSCHCIEQDFPLTWSKHEMRYDGISVLRFCTKHSQVVTNVGYWRSWILPSSNYYHAWINVASFYKAAVSYAKLVMVCYFFSTLIEIGRRRPSVVVTKVVMFMWQADIGPFIRLHPLCLSAQSRAESVRA